MEGRPMAVVAEAVGVKRLEIFGERPCRRRKRIGARRSGAGAGARARAGVWLDSSTSCSWRAGPGHIHTRRADGGHWNGLVNLNGGTVDGRDHLYCLRTASCRYDYAKIDDWRSRMYGYAAARRRRTNCRRGTEPLGLCGRVPEGGEARTSVSTARVGSCVVMAAGWMDGWMRKSRRAVFCGSRVFDNSSFLSLSFFLLQALPSEGRRP